ncbi:MAG: hypothetical protein HeimC3_26090 [Candidatus Heimdallarchaeota archaeon LC_3]|nr:MAG: hypothetical protein HeimC3_26090 [Candidatus Heimdallarchaeota archaeon LC_3]
MVAINFTVFIDKIRNGTKKQTIRKWNSDRVKQMRDKKILQLYTGMRTKECKLLEEVELEEILQLLIKPNDQWLFDLEIYYYLKHKWVTLSPEDELELIKLDGFENRDSFFNWFNKRYNLKTDLFAVIRWK